MTTPRAVPTIALLALLVGLGGCGDDDQGAAEDPNDELATEVSEAIESSGIEDLACLLADDVVAEAVGEDVSESSGVVGSSGGGSGDVEYSISYEGCDYALASGGEVTIGEFVDTDDATALEGYEQITVLVGVDEDAVAVPGLGDDAVQNDDDLLILVDSRAFFLNGETETGEDIEASVLQALGAEVVAALS